MTKPSPKGSPTTTLAGTGRWKTITIKTSLLMAYLNISIQRCLVSSVHQFSSFVEIYNVIAIFASVASQLPDYFHIQEWLWKSTLDTTTNIFLQLFFLFELLLLFQISYCTTSSLGCLQQSEVYYWGSAGPTCHIGNRLPTYPLSSFSYTNHHPIYSIIIFLWFCFFQHGITFPILTWNIFLSLVLLWTRMSELFYFFCSWLDISDEKVFPQELRLPR